jgi:galactose mutarotase-like enzyme
VAGAAGHADEEHAVYPEASLNETHTIAADGVSATIKALGAELCSLAGPDGAELIWQAEPVWPRHAPILFPIVGRLAGDALRVGGKSYTMGQHGFARDRAFAWTERGPASCRLELRDDAQTRAQYPFAFRLIADYRLDRSGLTLTLTVENPGPETLPASLGLHPAFAWPLRADLPKTAHRIRFTQPETAPVRRLAGGLLRPLPVPSPIEGRTLALAPALFADDAIILDRPASSACLYGAPGGPAVALAWHGFPLLGLWSKPADFLCIEPWHGHADPEGFKGDVFAKPGMAHLPPGGSLLAGLTISLRNYSDDD